MKICVVWLKRDLRLSDHEPLAYASETRLPVLLLYCFEPHLLKAPDHDVRHQRFCVQALCDINRRLQEPCLLVSGKEVVESLKIILEYFEIVEILSYEEVGNLLTFRRDKAVKNWAKQTGISLREFAQNGTMRGKKNRVNWQENLDQNYLRAAQIRQQSFACVQIPDSLAQRLKFENTAPNHCGFQPGGETFAYRYLNSFLQERHKVYSKTLSRPQDGRKGCSRLSPYLAFGCISARQVFQASACWGGSAFNLKSFISRLWWRSHYIQKLESDFSIEFEPINAAFKSLDRQQDSPLFEAWKTGKTGFPMVDASMRCLQETGWLNFRMRAMLVTFASFGLWLDFKPLALHLAKLFLDYDPGIHYPQIQMQAGLTGYHVLRIFNPTQQILKHDPEGIFIKTWLPELAELPMPLLAQPWKMTQMEQAFYNCRLGIDYPFPVVDYQKVLPINRDRYWQVRQSRQAKTLLPQIWQRFCLPEDIVKYQNHADSCGF